MTSSTFFIIFIPILAIILLAVNLILAPHNPYQEKDSVFECGFHSFLGQNRTQFSVSFFIFGLLFLLFDLEILLVYPYSVSSYTNDIYGLAIMMIFFVLLTLGFVFELGKNALTIESRQTSFKGADLSDPHAFLTKSLQSNFAVLIAKKVLISLFKYLKRYVLTNGLNFIYTKLPNTKKVLKYRDLILSIISIYEIIYTRFTCCIDRLFKIYFPFLYAIYVDIQYICCNVFAGKGYLYILYFLLLGFYLGSEYVFYCTTIIQTYPLVKYYNKMFILPYYPRLYKAIDFLGYIVYLAAIGICMEEVYSGIINPLWSKFIISLKIKWNGFLNASNNSQGNVNSSSSSRPSNNNPSPNPGPRDVIKTGYSEDNSKEKQKTYKNYIDKARKDHREFERLARKSHIDFRDLKYVNVDMNKEYLGYLPKEEQQRYTLLLNQNFSKLLVHRDVTATDFWLKRRATNKEGWDAVVNQIQFWEKNSKIIRAAMKEQNKNDTFPRDLEIYKNGWAALHRQKVDLIKSQLGQSSQFDKLLKENGKRFLDVLNDRD
jgi:NADH-ubiquinone oxidoreductase chain 3